MTIDSLLIRKGLATALLKPRVIVLETVDSTNDIREELARTGGLHKT